MSAKFFAILTHQGAARLANAAALGTKLNLTQLAIGDGGGVLPTPDPAQTALLGEKRRAALNLLSVDPNNTSQIIAEQIIPENEGGFWIREIGLFDDAGVLIAVANCPETYKPQLQEGSGRTQTIRMVLIVSSTESVTLKIDPSVVLATRKYVDDRVIEVKAYADNLLAQHVAAADPHKQYAPKNSPGLTGKPTAPTAAQTENSTQLATTAFVKAALSALVASSPAALDTLKELADALGNDANFSTTVMNALAAKQPLNTTLTALAGKDVAGLLTYLGLTAITTVSGSADNFPYFTGEKSARLTQLTPFARNLLSKPDEVDTRTALGLTAITSVPGAADNIPYFTSDRSARLTPLTAFARNLLSKTDDIDSRTALGLGSTATRNIGTGSTQVPDMSSFSNSIATGGYQRLPGGLIIQWGISSMINSSASVAITYPIPFPTKRLSISGNPQGIGQGNPGSPVFDVGDARGCNVSTWGSYNYQAMWIALGY